MSSKPTIAEMNRDLLKFIGYIDHPNDPEYWWLFKGGKLPHKLPTLIIKMQEKRMVEFDTSYDWLLPVWHKFKVHVLDKNKKEVWKYFGSIKFVRSAQQKAEEQGLLSLIYQKSKSTGKYKSI